MNDFERYCMSCGFAECRCGKNYHPTVNEVHAMYRQHAKLVEVARELLHQVDWQYGNAAALRLRPVYVEIDIQKAAALREALNDEWTTRNAT